MDPLVAGSLEEIYSKLQFSTSRIVILESFMRKFRTSHEDFSGTLTELKRSSMLTQKTIHVADADVADLKHKLQSLQHQVGHLERQVEDLKDEKKSADKGASQAPSRFLENQIDKVDGAGNPKLKYEPLAQKPLGEEFRAHALQLEDEHRDLASTSDKSLVSLMKDGAEIARLAHQEQHKKDEALTSTRFIELLAYSKRSSAWAPLPLPGSEKSIALLFPGTGEEYIYEGIRGTLAGARKNPMLVDMFNLAESVLQYSISDVIIHGHLDELKVFGPAVFLASIFRMADLLNICAEAALNPWAVAGIRGGEYAALCFAGVLSFEDALHMVMLRSELIQNVCTGPLKIKSLGVKGLLYDDVKQLCQGASTKADVCYVSEKSNRLTCWCTGTEVGINSLKELVDKAGRASWGNHWQGALVHDCLDCAVLPSLRDTQRQFREMVQTYVPKMSPPRCVLYMNAANHQIPAGTDPVVIVDNLVAAFTRCVDWEQSMKSMIQQGVSQFYNVGPGPACKVYMRNIDKGAWNRTTSVGL